MRVPCREQALEREFQGVGRGVDRACQEPISIGWVESLGRLGLELGLQQSTGAWRGQTHYDVKSLA